MSKNKILMKTFVPKSDEVIGKSGYHTKNSFLIHSYRLFSIVKVATSRRIVQMGEGDKSK
jgi:hypothetical protein